MRLCRFGGDRLGVIRQDHVVDVTSIRERLPNFRYPLPKFDPFVAELDSLRNHIQELADGQPGIPVAQVKFESPVGNQARS
jgi:2,4-didehydro-3-deoxy-L-rhamnonate hydrolase